MSSGHRIGAGAHIGGSLGDAVGRDKIVQHGDHNAVGGPDVSAAVAELRELVARLTRDGAVGEDGAVNDPGAVLAAVREPSGLRALTAAVAGGAKDAVLSAVRGGLAEMIVALVGRG